MTFEYWEHLNYTFEDCGGDISKSILMIEDLAFKFGRLMEI